jgi:chromosome segregation ATPase
MSKDLTQKLDGSLEDKVDRLITIVQSIDSRVENVETNLATRLEKLEARLESLEARLESLEARLESLETKVDERLKDTRPMWEAVQAQLTEVESSLRGEIRGLRAEMEKGFRMVDRRIEHSSGEMSRLYAYERDLEDRVDKIEKRLS